MEIKMLYIYFASLVMCVAIGCIPFLVRQEPEMSKEDCKYFFGFVCSGWYTSYFQLHIWIWYIDDDIFRSSL